MVAEARAEGRAAIDLEFLWERTYAPIACLAQLATPRGIHLVDPIDGAPLGPIAELVSDPDVEVVMHAPSADLTLLGHGLRHPARSACTDVQIVAGFVGLGAGQGLATLLERVLGRKLDKGERYTDWSRRPLSAAQLEYGAGRRRPPARAGRRAGAARRGAGPHRVGAPRSTRAATGPTPAWCPTPTRPGAG